MRMITAIMRATLSAIAIHFIDDYSPSHVGLVTVSKTCCTIRRVVAVSLACMYVCEAQRESRRSFVSRA